MVIAIVLVLAIAIVVAVDLARSRMPPPAGEVTTQEITVDLDRRP